MRWLWIDRFVEFVSGRRAVAIKNVTLVEEEIDDYYPRFPHFPAPLIIEGLAQTGGLLVAEQNQYRERVVLAKLGKAVFRRPVLPGDRLTYIAELQEVNAQGAFVRGQALVGDEEVATIDLMFAHLDDRFPSELFGSQDLVDLLRLFGLYEVGVAADGTPLRMPAHLLSATSAS